MNKINIIESAKGTSINKEGELLYSVLEPYFKNSLKVEVSFKDTTAMSTSFFNSSFGMLIDNYGLDKLRETVKICDITKAQFDLFKKYVRKHSKTDYIIYEPKRTT